MAEGDTSKILESIKAALGLQPDYDPFNTELLIHINSVVSDLNQLGVGPGLYQNEVPVLIVTDTTTWADLLLEDKLENVKSYMFLRVKMLFDAATMPPALITSYEKEIEKQEFRITVGSDPMIPQLLPGVPEEDPIILDSGDL
jgi:hypothetical protein